MDKDPLVVAATKGMTVQEMKALYERGYRHFGESRLQEAEEKMPLLPNDINWHFIGTLQSKKVSKVVGRFVLIHSVDSLELAQKISKVCQERHIKQDVLLQVNILQEKTKHGFSIEELKGAFSALASLPSLILRGLMAMAPKDDEEAARLVFSKTKELQKELQKSYNLAQFSETSMGMSDDYKIAIACGATMVRLGTILKGNYHEDIF